MRCKNCKTIIENPNLLRCPKCGKPVPKKKKIDKKELLNTVPFGVVSAIYVVFTFIALFFKCDYYNMTAVIISLIVYLVMLPFVFGNYKGLNRAVADCFGIAISLPFIANWYGVFVPNAHTLAINPFATAYYFSVIGSLILVDVILLLKALETIKTGKIAKWICLAAGIAEAVFGIVFYVDSKSIKVLAILVIAIFNFVPCFVGYNIISKDDKALD